MNININEYQRKFIFRAIRNSDILLDFDTTTEKEFKECFGLSKKETLNQLKDLTDELEGNNHTPQGEEKKQ